MSRSVELRSTKDLVWPSICCCCGDEVTALETQPYEIERPMADDSHGTGPAKTLDIPTCSACQIHAGKSQSAQRTGQAMRGLTLFGVGLWFVRWQDGRASERGAASVDWLRSSPSRRSSVRSSAS
jgi:hypothetical protein